MTPRTQGGPRLPAAGPTRPLDRSAALPLWAQLHADLVRRLDEGAFAGAFPGELALVTEYGVSRHTVREALRRLRQEGVVVAERGRAPRLAVPEIEQPLGALYSLFASVEAAGLEQRSVVRALDVRVDPEVSDRLELAADTPLLFLERLRMAGEEPLAMDRVWLPADVAAPLLDADFTHTALYDELARRTGLRLTGGRERIRAVVPDRSERRLLGVGAGVAAFAIDRLGSADGRPVEWRHTLVRGDRFSVSARYSQRTGYHLDLDAPFPTHAPGATS